MSKRPTMALDSISTIKWLDSCRVGWRETSRKEISCSISAAGMESTRNICLKVFSILEFKNAPPWSPLKISCLWTAKNFPSSLQPLIKSSSWQFSTIWPQKKPEWKPLRNVFGSWGNRELCIWLFWVLNRRSRHTPALKSFCSTAFPQTSWHKGRR